MTWPSDLAEFFHLGMDRILPPFLKSTNGPQINLGYGSKKMPEGVMSIGLPEWDAEKDPLPYKDESVVVIYALHFLEHIDNLFPLMHECQRVLKPEGWMNIVVPYGACHMALQDPTHVRFFNEDTWKTMFSNPYYDPSKGLYETWDLKPSLNVIMGVKGQNLALVTQLVKT